MAAHHPHLGLAVDTHSETSHPYWHEIRTLGAHPHRRSYHAAAAWGNSMVICGGQDLREGMVPGLWVFSQQSDHPELDTWVEIPSTESSPRLLCRSSAVVDRDNLYLFGGTDNASENASTYILDLRAQTWSVKLPEATNLPPPIDSHTAVVCNGQMVVFGGFIGGSRSSETFFLDLQTLTWTKPEVAGGPPSPRSGHSAVAYSGAVYIYGGCSDDGGKLSDIWKLSLSDCTWQRVAVNGSQPAGRSGHTACLFKSLMVVFGGMRDLTKETNEMFSFNLETSEWKLIQEEKKIEDPVSAVQLEEYKKSRSPNHKLTTGHSASPHLSPAIGGHHHSPATGHASPNVQNKGKHDSPSSPQEDSASSGKMKKRTSHLYEGPPSPLIGRIVGRAPYPRDGHSAVIMDDKMFVFGGDRYQMPFNDLYVFALNDYSLNPK